MRPTTSRTCFAPGCIHFCRGRILSPATRSCRLLSKVRCSSPPRSMRLAQANNFRVKCFGAIALRWRGPGLESSLAQTLIYGYCPWIQDACQHGRRTAIFDGRSSTVTAHSICFGHRLQHQQYAPHFQLDKINLATRPCPRVSILASGVPFVSQR